jgi:hypothetical protein
VIGAAGVILGTVFGPVILAAAASRYDASLDEDGGRGHHAAEAVKLVDAYLDQVRDPGVYLVDLPNLPKEICGYERERIFPRGPVNLLDRERTDRLDVLGRVALENWARQYRLVEARSDTAQRIMQHMSPFETGFVRRCMETTLFERSCFDRVETVLKLPARPRPRTPLDEADSGLEDHVMCNYVEGIAARKGISNAAR